VRLLLDTHIAIWVVMDDRRLSERARDLISGGDVESYVSAASIWQIAIKFALGRAGDPMPFSASDALQLFEQAGLRSLAVKDRHAAAVERLPSLHGDPFDRLLVAQAIAEPMRLVTRDRRLSAYSELVEVV
jgi:PIN domain nuclease of toxin-antitoxin system